MIWEGENRKLLKVIKWIYFDLNIGYKGSGGERKEGEVGGNEVGKVVRVLILVLGDIWVV